MVKSLRVSNVNNKLQRGELFWETNLTRHKCGFNNISLYYQSFDEDTDDGEYDDDGDDDGEDDDDGDDDDFYIDKNRGHHLSVPFRECFITEQTQSNTWNLLYNDITMIMKITIKLK